MSSSVQTVTRPASKSRWPKVLALAIVLLIAIAFVLMYVFHYYLNYNEAAFTSSAPNYWRMRGWLLLHITSGMVALLTGPWQFSRRLRQRYVQLHRISGRVYVIAVMCGCIAAFRLAIGTTFGWAWGFGLASLALAWFTTTGMAYYAIRQKQIQIHREWMVRSYVVTFAFVTFRALNDMGPTSHLQPIADRGNAFIWACWAIPLLVAEVILQLVRMPRNVATAARAR